jgi:hypothetical protein
MTFSAVDYLAYRSELREVNENNFVRSDAKMEQRLAEFRGELRTEMAALRGDMRVELHAMKVELHAMKAELIKWMFLFWAGTALAGLLLK